MNADELKRRYIAGERDFSIADLSGVKLIKAYLPGINLWAANLSGAVRIVG
ncbi:pentapeptide repeat-containing protein [Scytonema hofmannii FACHB-248]|uniref:Pentapeptide repeat-containing protein n=1 Tax=Scytonema hofmannii FACHB-248 TaxID=1842502 RepID=A0ABR8GS55_9CYAN|nr:pentapeptide repeat-containing protein [Scytonema hofmannii FACHB-248]